MIHETHTPDHKTHSNRIDFNDDFGHRHVLVHPTHITVDDPAKPFPQHPIKLVPYPLAKEVENIRAAMAEREQKYLEFCLDHPLHRHDPIVLAHPDHPNNKKAK